MSLFLTQFFDQLSFQVSLEKDQDQSLNAAKIIKARVFQTEGINLESNGRLHLWYFVFHMLLIYLHLLLLVSLENTGVSLLCDLVALAQGTGECEAGSMMESVLRSLVCAWMEVKWSGLLGEVIVSLRVS